MRQTVGNKFTYDQLTEILNACVGSYTQARNVDQQAYFEGTFPLETIYDPEGLAKRFSDIEDRLGSHIGEPVVCIRDGDVILLYMGIVQNPEILYQFNQNSMLPRGSASIQVEQLQIAAIIIDESGQANIEILPTPNGASDSHFRIEERAFKQISDTEGYECISSDWDLLVGNDEIDQFFGQTRLILPVRQRITPAYDIDVVETSAIELQAIRIDFNN